jgi:hypothetical protein
MLPDEAYLSAPELAPARHLQRAGQWDLALRILEGVPHPAAVPLRAEILVDRHAWRLDPLADALAAVRALEERDRPLAVLLAGQLSYWQAVFELGGSPVLPDPRAAFSDAAGDDRLRGWAVFFGAVVSQYLDRAEGAAGTGFETALGIARDRGDLLLESYALRHQGELAIGTGHARAIELLRLSLYLRAAVGARPQSAAGQATLADALGDVPEAAQLRRAAGHAAGELGLTWLRSSLAQAG